MVSTITPIICSDCGTGRYHVVTHTVDTATCDYCEHQVIITLDVEPYLDPESYVYVNAANVVCTITD